MLQKISEPANAVKPIFLMFILITPLFVFIINNKQSGFNSLEVLNLKKC